MGKKLDCSRWYTIANTCFFTFDLDPGVTVTGNVAQYLQHHVTYPGTKFKVANGLRGDRQTDAWMDRWTDFGMKLVYSFYAPKGTLGGI